jgi:hydrogenase maturation factor
LSLPKGKLGFADLDRLVFQHLPRVDDSRQVPLDFTTAPASGNLVAASDPVIGVPLEYYGFFAVHYSAADVSMAGAIPQYLTLGVYYPPDTPEKWLKNNMHQLGKEARNLDIRILGGHTGGYDGLTLPLISSTCLGFLPSEGKPTRSVKPNDILIAIGPVGRETLWFLANVEPEKIDALLQSSKRKQVAKDLIPFNVASVANSLSRQEILMMHDLAEGGLAISVAELSKATGLGIVIRYDSIPWDGDFLRLCTHFEWNPLHCSSFGSFLIVTSKDGASEVLDEIKQHGRPAAIIGKFTEDKQLLLEWKDKLTPLPKGQDPYKDYTAQVM